LDSDLAQAAWETIQDHLRQGRVSYPRCRGQEVTPVELWRGAAMSSEPSAEEPDG
jgi:hypothetical protein